MFPLCRARVANGTRGRLNGCAGLTAVPHQPFNTYSTVMFAIAGTFSAFYFAANSSIGLVFMLSMRPSPGWIALLGSVVLFGLAFRLHRIDFRKSRREGERKRTAEGEPNSAGGDVGEGEPAEHEPNGKSTPLIWKTLHAFWHMLAAGGTSALFYALLYPDIASGKC